MLATGYCQGFCGGYVALQHRRYSLFDLITDKPKKKITSQILVFSIYLMLRNQWALDDDWFMFEYDYGPLNIKPHTLWILFIYNIKIQGLNGGEQIMYPFCRSTSHVLVEYGD